MTKVPCKACGEFDCNCKYILAKYLVEEVNNMIDVSRKIMDICEEIIWNHEREV